MGCYYCPLSLEKRGKDVLFADELKVEREEDILIEAELIGATGTGITGGDPLLQPGKAARLIRLLKESFGERHHIHLYTPSTGKKSISTVAEAGLDEIRFHPPASMWSRLHASRFEKAISLSGELGMNVGLEIPVIPDLENEIRTLLEFASDLEVSFVNLNELEFSESNWRMLRSRGFDVKNDISGGIGGSERLALRLLSSVPGDLPVHYCSSSFKDGVQLRRRIMRRARRICRPLDLITEDGTLIMGIVETDIPERLALQIKNEFRVPKELIEVNSELRRIEIASWVLEEIAAELPDDSFIIEEYPTADRLEVEREKIRIRQR